MGMYTEMVLKVRILPNPPVEVEGVLQHLFNGAEFPTAAMIPNHAFFSCSRWASIGCCSSYYHIPWATSKYSEGYIFSRSDLKNCSDEVEHFIDWLSPYMDESEAACVGWSWYEEAETPTLLFRKRTVLVIELAS